MHWYHWLAIGSATVCLLSCLIHGAKLIRYGAPTEYAKKTDDPSAAIRYAYTGAMSPTKKESAYLHLPTYMAGLIYHIGTFLSLFLFILFLIGIYPTGLLMYITAAIVAISGLSGLGILIKRISKTQLRALSNPDDYISNLLVSLVQILTALLLINHTFEAAYFLVISLLFLYFPLGKLKHAVYFFAARYHLGFFYGWRGVWPPKHR